MGLHSQTYDWPRFWFPQTMARLSPNGFLPDPECAPRGVVVPTPQDLAVNEGQPCIILLGEAGMGKTDAIQRHYSRLIRMPQGGVSVLRYDLGRFTNAEQLETKLSKSDEIRAWRDGNGKLVLFLDALDECKVHVPIVSQSLIDIFEGFGEDRRRLHIRIASRPVAFSSSLETGLQQLWRDGVSILSLAPLRERDARFAAEHEGLDPEAFITEVQRVHGQAWASRPLTLQMLLRIFKRDASLPRSRLDVWRQGIELLCAETNERRRDVGAVGRVTVDHRLAILRRIAGLMTLCGYQTLCLAPDYGTSSHSEGTLSIRDITGAEENSISVEFEVTEPMIQEVVQDTGLFVSTGREQFSFSHQGLCEFLAAWYLSHRRLDLSQIIDLLRSPVERCWLIVPQLHDVAIWCATFNPEIFSAIAQHQPEILVAGDLATSSSAQRQFLVHEILARTVTCKTHDRAAGFSRAYDSLHYDGIGTELVPIIESKSANLVARRVAIDIAETGADTGCVEALVHVLLDASDSSIVRAQAADALSKIGGEKALDALQHVLNLPAVQDPNDDMLGYALDGLWRERLDLTALLSVIRPPRRAHYLGSYALFIHQLAQDLNSVELCRITSWLLEDYDNRISWLEPLIAPLGSALKPSGSEEMRAQIAKVVCARIRRFRSPLPSRLSEHWTELLTDADSRRGLFKLILAELQNGEPVRADLVRRVVDLLRASDLAWVLDQMETDGCETWSRIAANLFDIENPNHANLVLVRAEQNQKTATTFRGLTGSVSLTDPRVPNLRRAARRRLANERSRSTPSVLIQRCLTQLETGDLSGWQQLLDNLIREQDGSGSIRVPQSDLRNCPGWRSSTVAVQMRVLESASKYLAEAPEPRLNSGFNETVSGYLALYLMYCMRRDFPATSEAIQKWLPTIIAAHDFVDPDRAADGPSHASLLRAAHSHDPLRFCRLLKEKVLFECTRPSSASVLFELRHPWPADVVRSVEDCFPEVRDHRCQARLIEALLRAESTTAWDYVLRLVAEGLSEKSIQLLVAVCTSCSARAWTVIEPVLTASEAYATMLVEELARATSPATEFADYWPAKAVGEFYVYLSKRYPPPETAAATGRSVAYGPQEEIADMRTALLRNLQHRGTPDACVAIEHLIAHLPEQTHLPFVLVEAEHELAKKTWCPPDATELLALTRASSIRLARTSRELMAVVMDALARIERDLHGETPAVQFLWNGNQPKAEDALSDWIARQLRIELGRTVVATRNVEIRPRLGKTAGEETDIHITAVVSQVGAASTQQLRVIVETKGCWNKKLKADMEKQLVNRYLEQNDCRHGIYVIGWFRCSAWDDGDYRKESTPSWELEEARRWGGTEANRLSNHNRHIQSFVMDLRLGGT